MPLGECIRGRIRHGLNNPLVGIDWVLKFAGSPGVPQLVQCPLWTPKDVGVTFTFWIKSNRTESAYGFPSECVLSNGAYNHPLKNGYGIYWGSTTAPKRLWFYQHSIYTVYDITFDFDFLKWTHVGIVLIDADPKIKARTYVNGVFNGERSNITKGALPTNRSCYGASDQFVDAAVTPLMPDVWLDEIRVWERALTDAEILADMFMGTPNPTNLVAWYSMNEGIGTLTKDKSGLNKDGTIINGAAWDVR